MILYHFTSMRHLPKILAAGYLKVTESNLSRNREHAGPDVVWLTRNGEPGANSWWQVAGRRSADKAEVRFTVEVPSRAAHRWRDWARKHGIDPEWARRLAEAGGGGSGSWYVVERAVQSAEWTEILNTRTGGQIGDWSAGRETG